MKCTQTMRCLCYCKCQHYLRCAQNFHTANVDLHINKFDEVLCFFMALCWRLAVRAKVDGIFQLLCSMIKCAAFFRIFFSFRKLNRFLIIFEVAVKIMANIIYYCSITSWMNRHISFGLLDLVFVMLRGKIHNSTKNCNNQLLGKEPSFQWDNLPIAASSGAYTINSNWMGQKLGNKWEIRNRNFFLVTGQRNVRFELDFRFIVVIESVLFANTLKPFVQQCNHFPLFPYRNRTAHY